MIRFGYGFGTPGTVAETYCFGPPETVPGSFVIGNRFGVADTFCSWTAETAPETISFGSSFASGETAPETEDFGRPETVPESKEQVAQEFVGPVFGVPKKRIKLESLHGFSSHKSNRWWLEDANCPFDISCLKAFGDSLRNDAHGDIPATAYATIEIICTNLYSKQPYDLSGFQRLAQVKITTDGLEVSSDLEMIRTILPQNRSRLEAIQVYISHSSDTIKALIDLDSEISTLQSDFYNLKIVEITTKTETPTLTKGVEEYFPLLNQTTSLRWNFRPGTEAPCSHAGSKLSKSGGTNADLHPWLRFD
ncbi:hypothetical protein B0H11DRAFT_1918686 [Mycena galericulata]|nr:hypothetical protein B0H11DRAFT_1918686 [Mycena galericulata]